jgi:GntR family transcriptional repressor for pyruvate dehydrogenase complex
MAFEEAESDVISRRRLYEDVRDRLEADICAGRYAQGGTLPSERELMKRFGVGRPSVREALQALQKMGLVRVGSGERTRVARPTPSVLVSELRGAARLLLAEPEGLYQFLSARKLFEAALARHAAEVANDADIEALGRALEAHRAALGNPQAAAKADIAFHAAIVGIARNPIFRALHAAVSEWLEEHWARSNRASGESQAIGFRAHSAIHDAIRAHDRDRAEREMAAHLDALIGQLTGPEPVERRITRPRAQRTRRGSKGARERRD